MLSASFLSFTLFLFLFGWPSLFSRLYRSNKKKNEGLLASINGAETIQLHLHILLVHHLPRRQKRKGSSESTPLHDCYGAARGGPLCRFAPRHLATPSSPCLPFTGEEQETTRKERGVAKREKMTENEEKKKLISRQNTNWNSGPDTYNFILVVYKKKKRYFFFKNVPNSCHHNAPNRNEKMARKKKVSAPFMEWRSRKRASESVYLSPFSRAEQTNIGEGEK